MSEPLLPCPFCDGPAETLNDGDHYRSVGCNDCDFGMASQGGEPPDIYTRWNRRSSPTKEEMAELIGLVLALGVAVILGTLAVTHWGRWPAWVCVLLMLSAIRQATMNNEHRGRRQREDR